MEVKALLLLGIFLIRSDRCRIRGLMILSRMPVIPVAEVTLLMMVRAEGLVIRVVMICIGIMVVMILIVMVGIVIMATATLVAPKGSSKGEEVPPIMIPIIYRKKVL